LVDYLDRAVSTESFRGAVEVRRGEEVLLRRGFGLADPAAGVANGPNTRFRIASVSKQFTALAILILQTQGKLGVANSVCQYLPNCPPQWAPITVDQLLTHTSGIHDYSHMLNQNPDQFFAAAGSRAPTPEQLVATFASLPLDFPPTTRWAYSNSGYVLLGYLVERLSGKSYGDFLHDEVLDPLGMSDTGYQPGHVTGPQYAVGYKDWTTPALVLDDSVYFAAGGLYSTVTDLGRWQRFLLTGDPAVVTKDVLDDLLLPRVAANATTWYGYGIESRGASMSAITSYGHSGGIPGYNSYVEIVPATGVAVSVLANVTLDPERYGRDLAALVPRER
jgi:CubicO group peptidase (beta-lactamase class C family)